MAAINNSNLRRSKRLSLKKPVNYRYTRPYNRKIRYYCRKCDNYRNDSWCCKCFKELHVGDGPPEFYHCEKCDLLRDIPWCHVCSIKIYEFPGWHPIRDIPYDLAESDLTESSKSDLTRKKTLYYCEKCYHFYDNKFCDNCNNQLYTESDLDKYSDTTITTKRSIDLGSKDTNDQTSNISDWTIGNTDSETNSISIDVNAILT
jgi:hypothetical protein